MLPNDSLTVRNTILVWSDGGGDCCDGCLFADSPGHTARISKEARIGASIGAIEGSGLDSHGDDDEVCSSQVACAVQGMCTEGTVV